MKNFLTSSKFHIALILILSSALRLLNLNYSHFQGDEIRALFTSGSLVNFLMDQKKGPVQFVITYLIDQLFGNYNEFITRLPFAIAGIAACVVLYVIINNLYGKKVALISALLFSFNGFFVGFSRITQYQSFTYLFYLLAIYYFVRLEKNLDKKDLLVGSSFLALGFLSHYDAIFVAPICGYFWLRWFIKSAESRNNKIIFTVLSALTFILISFSFYGPFFLSEKFSGNTSAYLFTRLVGDHTDQKITNTKITYELYNPLVSIYFIFFFALIGVFIYKLKLIPLYLWFLPPFILLNFLTSVPGTHIYNYVLPAIVLASTGIVGIYNLLQTKEVKGFYFTFVFAIIAFFFYQSYMIFVDHEPEYPYYDKKILGVTVSMPPRKYHLSIFGFPYNRKLDEVNDLLMSKGYVTKLTTNENTKIVNYYVASKEETIGTNVYLYVYSSQSLTYKKSSKVTNLVPYAVFTRGKTPLSEVYLIKETYE